MDTSARKRRKKEFQELVAKLEAAIRDESTEVVVMDALCYILGNQCVHVRKSGVDKETYLEMVNEKIACAIRIAETFE